MRIPALIILFIAFAFKASAQQADTTVYDRYLDFNLARLDGDLPKAFEIGKKILPNVDKLAPKEQISFYNSIGKVYEDSDQPDAAELYYKKVAEAMPDYYVVHRALGYIYADRAKRLFDELNTAVADKKNEAFTKYKAEAELAAIHLEKAQACDPSDETLELIKSLYTNMKDEKGLKSLNKRIKEKSKTCIDILSDQ
ncbi:hypothetical protein [Mucilaginibacter gynuensis]